MQPCGQGSFLDVAGVDVPHAAGLGRKEHDKTTLGKVGESIHQRVHEVAVILAPPQNHRICDVAVVLFLQFGATEPLDGQAEVVIDVVVISELLDHLSSGKAQLCHQTLRCRGLRGANH